MINSKFVKWFNSEPTKKDKLLEFIKNLNNTDVDICINLLEKNIGKKIIKDNDSKLQ
jgi:hypothetical protein